MLTYTEGKRGKSKSEVKLSISTLWGGVQMSVWENGKVTHTFYPDKEFLQQMVEQANTQLELIELNLQKVAEEKANAKP